MKKDPLQMLMEQVKESNDPMWRQRVEPLLEGMVARLLLVESRITVHEKPIGKRRK